MTSVARRPSACPDPQYSGRDLDRALDVDLDLDCMLIVGIPEAAERLLGPC
jgi:hypothetical protein